jgi:DNA-binding NtrC family response regulator
MPRENFRILVVDDEQSFLLLLTRILQDAGYTVKGMTNPAETLKILDAFLPNLIITDMKMPGMDGIAFMESVRGRYSDVDFIMITAFATVETAVAAMKLGASDYITKPLNEPEQLRLVVSKVYEKQRLVNENRFLMEEVFEDLPPQEIIFAGMESVLREIRDVAPTEATVILYGETGTGKSLIAGTIHRLSNKRGPFVDINCAAIPENLLESELFGYEKGAFTGAVARKKGRFEMANDGSIFLDEVSEMSLFLQVKLLKVLQERTFERLGSVTTLKTNARVIAATNRDLRELVSTGKFREDLFYRLNVFPVNIPPLRERKDHIPAISGFLSRGISARLGKGPKTIGNETMRRLREYSWPGNIRELENILERGIITSRGPDLVLPEFSPAVSCAGEAAPSGDLRSVEKAAIENTLAKTVGNRRQSAEMLGISLRTLQYKIKEYGL